MTTAEELSKPFPSEMERFLKKGNANLTYIPQAEVINRLNAVLGVENWSMTVKRAWIEPGYPDFVLAHAQLEVTIGGQAVIRDGFGGQKINRLKSKEPVDLGDDFKGAVSDAMKKAATTLGVGLYLARDSDALDFEEAEKEVVVESESWINFKSLSKNLSDEGRAALGEFWVTYSGGRPKPTAADNAEEDLEALCAEAVRLTLDGQYVADSA